MIRRIVLTFLFAGVCIQCALAQNKSDTVPAAASFDRLVEVGGGRRLHIICTGVVIGRGPTVLLESGAGNAGSVWDRVQPEVAKFTRVCSYDRAGLGRSDPVPTARTVIALTDDLHSLLVNAKVTGPYILVGHSLGGILVRLYASYYPREVAGMVLVDSAHEDEPDRAVALVPPDVLKGMLKQFGPADLMPQSQERIDSCSIRMIMNALNWHGDIPLVVLTQGRPYGPDMVAVPSIAPQTYQLHMELQRNLTHRSPRGRQVIAEKSGHAIHQDQPEMVITAIREVIEEANKL